MQALSEEQKRVLCALGIALLSAQTAERLIDACLTYIIQLDGPLTLELLSQHRNRKRTLGQILCAMRLHIDVEDQFDATLSEFLEKRNVMIHRLDDVNWSLESDAGIVVAKEFLSRLLRLSETIMQVFGALADAWARQNPGMPTFPKLPGAPSYAPYVDQIFSKSLTRNSGHYFTPWPAFE
jgi:hypothetical protein